MKRYTKVYHTTPFEKPIREAGILAGKYTTHGRENVLLNQVIDRFRPRGMKTKRSDCAFFNIHAPHFNIPLFEAIKLGKITIFEATVNQEKALVGDDSIASKIRSRLKMIGAGKRSLSDPTLVLLCRTYWQNCVSLEYLFKNYQLDGKIWRKKKGAQLEGPKEIRGAEVLCHAPVKNINKFQL